MMPGRRNAEMPGRGLAGGAGWKHRTHSGRVIRSGSGVSADRVTPDG
jgi:hypothetical protein